MKAGATMRHTTARRLAREERTIAAMIALYCRDRHRATPDACAACSALRAYAHDRLVRCPFGADKPTCLNCAVHCYRGDMRERVRDVMRKSGPRMLLRYPVLTLLHLYCDSRRDAPSQRRPRRPADEARVSLLDRQVDPHVSRQARGNPHLQIVVGDDEGAVFEREPGTDVAVQGRRTRASIQSLARSGVTPSNTPNRLPCALRLPFSL